jgi:hypothetical protein
MKLENGNKPGENEVSEAGAEGSAVALHLQRAEKFLTVEYDVYGCVDAEYDIEKELSGRERREKSRELVADECS